jgi:hypothetical protein
MLGVLSMLISEISPLSKIVALGRHDLTSTHFSCRLWQLLLKLQGLYQRQQRNSQTLVYCVWRSISHQELGDLHKIVARNAIAKPNHVLDLGFPVYLSAEARCRNQDPDIRSVQPGSQ